MTDDSAQAQGGLQIPVQTQQQFPDLVDLIVNSKSMNDEERQYWINILPVMTPDQLGSLQEILDNERTQLDAIEKAQEEEQADEQEREASAKALETERSERREERQAMEQASQEEESATEEDILAEIEGL